MHITCVELFNYGPFAGTQTKDLNHGVHALIAKHVDDEERSNWLGKTWWMHAVPFANYGTLPPKCRLKDDWITRGCKEGFVRITYSTGLTVKRSLKIGDSMQLDVEYKDAEGRFKKARADRAQEIINQHIGLDDDSFFWMMFLRQKEMNRLLETSAAELHRAASQWFDLGKLADGEKYVKEELSLLLEKHNQISNKISYITGVFDTALGELGIDASQLDSKITEAEQLAEQARDEAAKAQAEMDEYTDWAMKAGYAAQYEKLRDEADAIYEELREMNPKSLVKREEAARDAEQAAAVEMHNAIAEAKSRAANSAGKFDGMCPVMCEKCPAAKDVHRVLKTNRELVEQADTKERAARQAHAEERAVLREAQTALRHARDLKAQFDTLKKRALELKDAHEEIEEAGELPDIEDLKKRANDAWQVEHNAALLMGKLRQIRNANVKRIDEIAQLRAEKETLEREIALRREAAYVFGRRGAQRLIAETALADVEALANDVLTDAGVDLRAVVSWAREGRGLAKHCDSCGHPFPRSNLANECERCGSKRGPHLIEELTFRATDSSGAADDIVGMAGKLALSAWRRRKHSVPFSTVFLDEPMAACDAKNRSALASAMVTMLTGKYGFEQAFVTSHDQAVLATLPERVEIQADEEGSKVL